MTQTNQIVLDEQDVINTWLGGNHIDRAVFDDIEPIRLYNKWCDTYDVDKKIEPSSEYKGNDYPEHCINNWHMPEEYKNYNIYDEIVGKCETAEELYRVSDELQEFEKRGMMPVLQFLKYMVDTCKENNIVIGVGRGSSVASYCLYLLGVHRVNSLKYNLNIKEFLK
jgi:DNA polymerase III alpha subunit